MASRTRRAPWLIALAVLAVLVLVAAALLWRSRADDGSEAAQALAAALSAGDGDQEILGDLLDAGATPQVTLADPGEAERGTRTVTLDWSWTLPDEAGTWDYTTTATLTKGEDGWEAALDPAAFAPDLTEGEHLDLDRIDAELGTITDRDGNALFGAHDVTTVGIDKTRSDEDAQEDAARRLADILGTDPDRLAECLLPTVLGDATDDAGLVEALGVAVQVVPGDAMAFKVTTQFDLAMARMIGVRERPN